MQQPFVLPIFILVGTAFNTVGLQFCNHAIKLAFPKLFEPVGAAKPFDQCGADDLLYFFLILLIIFIPVHCEFYFNIL